MRTLTGLICSIFLALAAFAQVGSSITGTVTDPTGAVVPNAPLEVRNTDTGAVFAGGTSATGNYVIVVPPGNYELTVKQPGFKQLNQKNLVVGAETSLRQDVRLEVGGATDVVTITDAAPLLKTESADVSHNFTVATVDNLPVLTVGTGTGFGAIRNPLQAVNLLPGMQFQQDFILRVNGLPNNSESIRIEGQDATNGLYRGATAIVQQGVEAIQEVAVQTSNYAAEFGQAAGGYFNFTMKSGTNQYHGSAYDYFVNEALNAGLPYTNGGTSNSQRCYTSVAGATAVTAANPTGSVCTAGNHIVNKQRRNDYGFTIGGPIRIPRVYNGHDRSFFFFNFEQFRENQGFNTGLATVPTPAYRAGDFSTAQQVCPTPVPAVSATACPGGPGSGQDLTQGGKLLRDSLNRPIPQFGVYDPGTSRLGPDGIPIRDLYPNARIPLTSMDPIALAIQSYLPMPNNPNPALLINNYSVPFYTSFKHTSNPSIKIDHSISPTIKVSGYVSRQLTYQPNHNGFNEVLTGVAPTNNRSTTVRLNYDQTLKPTLLLHVGVGYLYTYSPSIPPSFDLSTLNPPAGTVSTGSNGKGLTGFYTNIFPNFSGLSNGLTGGNSVGVGAGSDNILYDEKPTGNATLTWVKGNHTYKFGAELGLDGLIGVLYTHGNGNFSISPRETSSQWEGVQSGVNSNSGFNYASFLLGQVDSFTVQPNADERLGNHALGLFAQDTWKVTRKLTLDYGLRYDYQTPLREQYGRLQMANFNGFNTTVGRLGTVQYEGFNTDGVTGRCNCIFQRTYPWGFGPRVGVAYQINPKTVLRVGAAMSYGTTSNSSYVSINAADFYTFQPNGYGLPAIQNLKNGNPYAPGNPFGNPALTWPNFDPNKYPTRTVCPGTVNATCYAPQSPFIILDGSGRPPRVYTFSIGLQREVTHNLVVEASYVGNRGMWFSAPGLSSSDTNGLNITDVARFGGSNPLNINRVADGQLLLSPISSPSVIARGLGTIPYTGFPSTSTLIAAIRPYPQWNAALAGTWGPPLGNTWYDSLQAKVTKRYSHGLDLQGSFVYSKELSLGVNSDTPYATAFPPIYNDVFNRNTNKQLTGGFSQPFQLTISGTYTTRKITASNTEMRLVSLVLKDWQLGAVMKYQSGPLIATPGSANGLIAQLGRSGFGTTLYNLTNGNKNLFASGVDPNSKSFDPTVNLVLNPAAWVDAPQGQFGTSAAYYNNYRWQRRPSENMNFGRNFRIGKEGKQNLQIRAEFQNILNRHFYSTPGGSPVSNPAFGNPGGTLSSGFGYVNWLNGAGSQPRTGLLVGRFTF